MKEKIFLSYVMSVALGLCCWWFGPVWQGALLGRSSALLEKCLSSDYDGSSNCRRKCLFVVWLLHIWTAVRFRVYVHACKSACLRVETCSARSIENTGLYSVLFSCIIHLDTFVSWHKNKTDSTRKNIFIVKSIPHLQIAATQLLVCSFDRHHPVVLFNVHEVFYSVTTRRHYIVNNT